MAVCTNTIRSGLLTVLVVASVVALASLGGVAVQPDASAAAVQANSATFENGTVVEQRGDVARFTVLFDGTDRANVTVGSSDVNYQVSFTVVDGDGDGEATVAINTAIAGQENASNITAVGQDNASDAASQGNATAGAGVRALGSDEIADYEMTTEPLSGPLDAATYDVELSVDGELVSVGALVLNDRSLDGMSVWTAPGEARPNDSSGLHDVVSRNDRVAQGDLAVLAVDVSGVYGYVEDLEDLDNPAYGLNVSLVEDPGMNQPEQRVEVSPTGLVADGTNDTMFVLLDTDDLTVGSEYTATFAINDSNPYLASGANESTSATFAVVERTLSFDNVTAEGQLELPATTDATVSGTTSAAAGTVIEVQLRTMGAGAFLRTGEATVTEDGNWSVEFDLSEASNGTEFELRTDNPSANVSGVIVESETTATPGEETETPTNATDTPEDGETATTTETGTAETETPEEGATEEAVETTTAGEETTTASEVLTAGVTGSSVGLVGLLVGAVLVVLRRR